MAYILGIWGEAELFLGIWGAKANTFRETRELFAGKRGDQCIIFRDQGRTENRAENSTPGIYQLNTGMANKAQVANNGKYNYFAVKYWKI